MVAVERTFAMIKPHCYNMRESIIKLINDSNSFQITYSTTIQFTPQLVDQFYSEHIGKHFYSNLSNCMCEGPTLCLVLEGDDVIAKWRNFIGPTNVNVACETSPQSLRALFGDKTNTARNAVHGSDSLASVERELKLIFG
jgi:nucleoside-diphosphate kinase